MLVKHKYNKVLYLTISTGIGSGIITNKEIDPEFIDSEAGQIILEHDGRPEKWEKFASGSAIVKHFGKQAHDIHDQKSWHLVAANIAEGLLDLIPIIQPGVIIIGGGAGSYFDRFSKFLVSDLRHYDNALAPIPPIIKAQRPSEAVLYGCYDLAKANYG
jgi:predicted NBD/HSP70 family sugar kinase